MLSLEDRMLILDLYAGYNQAIDGGDVEKWLSCFTPDGVFITDREFVGHRQLSEFAVERTEHMRTGPLERVQHWNNNLLLFTDGEVVRGSCYLSLVARERASGEVKIVVLGEYDDEIVAVDGQWRFSRRTLRR